MANMTLKGYVRTVMRELIPYIKEGSSVEFELYVALNTSDGKLYMSGEELGVKIKFSLPCIESRYR